MKKIKKFRVRPRASSVMRFLKLIMGNTQVTPELEKAVETEIHKVNDLYATAAVYQTFKHDEVPDWGDPLWDTADESGTKPVAVTFFAVTIGTGLEYELGEAIGRGESLRSHILTSVAEESAEQAARFVYRLLGEEVKGESCALSERVDELSQEGRRNILSLLDSSKVEISLDNTGHLSPRFTRTGHVLWRPLSKKKR